MFLFLRICGLRAARTAGLIRVSLGRPFGFKKFYIRIMEENKMEESKLKKIMYALLAVAVVLAAALAYIWFTKAELVKDLNAEKEDLTQQMIALQNDYATLSSDYDAINSQLDSSREEVSQLIERIKTTEATNRRKMRQYEKELGTLRSIMKNYIVQIDSLNTLNKRLTADAAAARKAADESNKRNEELNRQVTSLSEQVATGSVIKGRGLSVQAYNSTGKVTDRSSRVVRLLASISLVENELAPKGPVRIYIRVKDPDGTLLVNSSQRQFTVDGQPMICTASREVDYQGAEVDLSIYVNDIPEYVKGIYNIEAYTEQSLLGTAELMLR